MKIFNPKTDKKLTKNLENLLESYRQKRNFIPEEYLEAKSFAIAQYFKKSNISGAVLGISGGVDSAVALGIMIYTQKKYPSIIKKIIPVTLPVFNTSGVVNQDDAKNRAEELFNHWDYEGYCLDLSNSFSSLKNEVNKKLNIEGKSWADGQLVPYLRTPCLYYITSLLNQENFPALVVGTTNQDEGAYLGYFGKASDGMVDLQIISDLHKSEVYTLADFLNTSKNIIKISPTGDMFDGRNDEEVFGAPYDFVELYMDFLRISPKEKTDLLSQLSDSDLEVFNFFKNNLDKLHEYNQHKYKVGSPAFHLDLLPCHTPKGWNNYPHLNHIEDSKNIVGYINFNPYISKSSTIAQSYPEYTKIKSLISAEDCMKIINSLPNQWVKANINGKKDEVNSDPKSYRLSFFNKNLSEEIFNKINIHLPKFEVIDNELWALDSVSNLFRIIKYSDGGELVPHYDESFVFNENFKTLKSMVIYLTNNNSGATRFLEDLRDLSFLEKNNYPDGNKYNKYIIKDINLPEKGEAIIFNHRSFHDSEPVKTEEKIIIRTDLVYRKII